MSGFQPVRNQPMFEWDNDFLIPTQFAAGPWHPNSLHGSVMMGIMARAAERYPSDRPRQVARLTVDMMRAAPMAPFTIETRVVRAGKSIDVLELSWQAEGEEYVRGSAMRIRTDDFPVGDPYRPQVETPQPPAKPITDRFFDWPGADQPGYHHTIDVAFNWFHGNPIMWFRSCVPLVDGEPLSPLQRMALSSDWTYSIPNIDLRIRENKSTQDYDFAAINPDTTLNISRLMQGEWFGILTRINYQDHGMGVVSGEMFDTQGALGFSSQSVLIRGAHAVPMHHKKQHKNGSD